MSPNEVDSFLRTAGHLRAHESIFDPQELDVITEIARDSTLTDSNKGLLISVYAALSQLEPDHAEDEHLEQVHETPDPVAMDKDSSNRPSPQPQPERTPRPDDLLTAEEVCDVLGLSRAALYGLRYRGEAPPAIKVGRQLRWQRSELDRWIAEKPVGRASR